LLADDQQEEEAMRKQAEKEEKERLEFEKWKDSFTVDSVGVSDPVSGFAFASQVLCFARTSSARLGLAVF